MSTQTYRSTLLDAAGRWADSPIYRYRGEDYPLGRFVETSTRVTAVLRSLGVGPRDPFSVLATNSATYANLWQAALLGGGVINPLNTRSAPAELAFQLQDAGSRVLFVGAPFLEVALRLAFEAEQDVQVVAIDNAESETVPSLSSLLDDVATELPDEPSPEDPVLLVYTGGTTGRPKGAVQPHRTPAGFVEHLTSTLGEHDPSIAVLGVMPMFHIAAAPILFAMPAVGNLTVLADFNPNALVSAIEQNDITHIAMAPSMVAAVLASEECTPERLRSLRCISYGGAPMSRGVVDRMRRDYPQVGLVQYFGMTEAGLLTALTTEDHRVPEPKLGSVGRALAAVELRIVDALGEDTAPGEPGEILAKSPSVMLGYRNRPEATAAAFVDGWYRTGDVGYLDESGFLYVLDRAKDVIITGGENVYSAEVEGVISKHPDVALVAVIGVPSEKWGEAVHAIVVPQAGADLQPEQIITYAREFLGGFKVPKTVEIRTEPLEMTPAGKIRKNNIRDAYWKDTNER